MTVFYITKGPGWGNYFILDKPFPYGSIHGQRMTLWGARRKARRLLKRGIPRRNYITVEEVR